MLSGDRGAPSTFFSAFERDDARCVYCDKDLMDSFDSFALVDLDHLKPLRTGGSNEIVNRVIACKVCNSLKADFDPFPMMQVTDENRMEFLSVARSYVEGKRTGKQDCSIFSDYCEWRDWWKRNPRRTTGPRSP